MSLGLSEKVMERITLPPMPEVKPPKQDNVNHPSHYETGKFECIEVMQEAIGVEDVKGFCICNAFKYIYRCCHKHKSPLEDVKKAIWYLNKFVELEEQDESKRM